MADTRPADCLSLLDPSVVISDACIDSHELRHVSLQQDALGERDSSGREAVHATSSLSVNQSAIHAEFSPLPDEVDVVDAVEAEERELQQESEHTPSQLISWWKMCALTICLAGVQFGWSIQIGQITPILRNLGVAGTGTCSG